MVRQLPRRAEPPIFGPEGWQRTREAKRRFLRNGSVDGSGGQALQVRPEILLSWKRSVLSGVDMTTSQVSRLDPVNGEGVLLRAARPVLDRLSDQLDGAGSWAMLFDRECRLLSAIGDRDYVRRSQARGAVPGAVFGEAEMGTNGAGTAYEVQDSFVVSGTEHFREAERDITSTGVLLRDPMTRRESGLLCLISRYEFASPLLLSFTEELGRSIEERMGLGRSLAERALFDAFLRVSRRATGPVLALGGTVLVANAAARRVFARTDQDLLRHRLLDAVADGRQRTIELSPGPGDEELRAVCHPVASPGGVDGGVVVEVVTPRPDRPRRKSAYRGTSSITAYRLHARIEQAERSGLPVLLRGEQGSGKSRLAAGPERSSPARNFTVLDAERSAVEPSQWAGRLTAALADPAATVVVRHLDSLAPELVATFRGALDTAAAHCRVTAGEGILSREDLAPVVGMLPVIIDVPPLRDRVEDIPRLVADLIAELTSEPGLPSCTPDALAVLLRSSWPGNVRQLRQVLASALANRVDPYAGSDKRDVPARTGDITLDDLPADLLDGDPRRHLGRLERLERHAIVTAIREADGDKEAAAAVLGLSRATIYRRIKQFGIHE